MLNETIGPVNDRLLRLGTPQSVIYLVKGEEQMLIGGAGQWAVATLEAQLRTYRIDMDRVRYLLIGHSHYDHCGAVPYLQKRYPHLQVLASRGAAHLYAMEKAVRNMAKFSAMGMQAMGTAPEFEGIPLAFDGVSLARTLEDGDRVDLGGGLELQVFETPGHSRCSIMVYEPRRKWLFPSDSLPLPANGGRGLVCTASESFTDYLKSIARIARLPVELCAWEHYGYMTDDSAREIATRAETATREYRQQLKARAQSSGDLEATAKWAADEWQRDTALAFIPRLVIEHITRSMVQNALAEPRL